MKMQNMTMAVLLTLCASTYGFGQTEQFDNLILDGGTGTQPTLQFNTGAGDGLPAHQIFGTTNSLHLSLDPDGSGQLVKVQIDVDAANNGLVLEEEGISVRGQTGIQPNFRLFDNSNNLYRIRLYEGGLNSGGMDFDTPNGNGILTITQEATDGSLTIDDEGVGIGTDGFSETPEATLHVLANSLFSPYTAANVLLEDQNSARGLRNMLELKNNGGVRIRLNNTSIGQSWAMSTDQTNKLQFRVLGAGTPFFGQRGNGFFEVGTSGQQTFTVAPNGNAFIRGTLRVQSIKETSDRNAKEDFEDVNADEILEKLVSLPMTSWKYKGDTNGDRHIGPIAQDFHAMFQLTKDDTTIAPLDTAGVSIVAIQSIYKKMQQKDKAMEKKDELISELKESNDDLLDRIERLEAAVNALTAQ